VISIGATGTGDGSTGGSGVGSGSLACAEALTEVLLAKRLLAFIPQMRAAKPVGIRSLKNSRRLNSFLSFLIRGFYEARKTQLIEGFIDS